jgi:hypothetical protein
VPRGEGTGLDLAEWDRGLSPCIKATYALPACVLTLHLPGACLPEPLPACLRPSPSRLLPHL